MHWESLFDDLEAQVEAADQAELDAELRDRARAEQARLRTVDRLRAAVGSELDLRLRGGFRERGRLLRVGPDWLLLAPEDGRETVVPAAGVLVIGGLGRGAVEPGSEGALAARLDLRHVLRGIARDRSRVVLGLDGGALLSGVLLRVGADHLDVGERVRAPEPQVVPLHGVSVVRRATDSSA